MQPNLSQNTFNNSSYNAETMKKIIFIAIVSALIVACKGPQTPVTAGVSAKDSLIREVQRRDSSVMAYIRSINNIQKGIDTLMMEAKILKMHEERPTSDTSALISDLKTIRKLILKNQKDITALERKLRISREQNQDLVDLGENLSKQLNEKDSEIAAIQQTLFKTRASLANTVKQLNDSINVIIQQRAQISMLQIKGNTVYFVIGTQKDLKNGGIIMVNGGVVGLGRVPTPGPDMSTSGFKSADLTNLHQINLDGRFVRMVTPHPTDSYRITTGSADKIIITDPEDFWSKSKYLIIIIK